MAKWQRLFSIGNSYHERNLFSFKLPEFFIWLVMSSMLLVAFGEEISKELSLRGVEVYGLNILRIVGCLYFFQGMGIYQNFLDVLKIRGILRTLLVLLTVFSLPMVVAFIGFIDVWVQFERFFKITKKDDKKL